jgi:hypothetical protein
MTTVLHLPIVDKYPDTPAARKAAERLKKF